MEIHCCNSMVFGIEWRVEPRRGTLECLKLRKKVRERWKCHKNFTFHYSFVIDNIVTTTEAFPGFLFTLLVPPLFLAVTAFPF